MLGYPDEDCKRMLPKQYTYADRSNRDIDIAWCIYSLCKSLTDISSQAESDWSKRDGGLDRNLDRESL